jgi:hypothetical protein
MGLILSFVRTRRLITAGLCRPEPGSGLARRPPGGLGLDAGEDSAMVAGRDAGHGVRT